MGQIYTFYSYKGGVGRSMALANVSVILAKWGYNVLVIDWDLEAPGIEYYFKEFLNISSVQGKKGVIDILTEIISKNIIKFNSNYLKEMLIEITIPDVQKSISLITAGLKDENYFKKVRNFNIDAAYDQKGGIFIEDFRKYLIDTYDFILLDSRTGITDYSGICTIHLPDILVLLFTATEQSLDGIVDVADKAYKNRKKLPFDRESLISIPVLSKFDAGEEFKISQWWLDHSAKKLEALYLNWLPRDIKNRKFLEITKIPYIPYFSFGEKLAVIEQGTTDPSGIGYAYETLSALIANNMQSIEKVVDSREKYITMSPKYSFRERLSSKKWIPKIFLSSAAEDRDKMKDIYDRLINAGFNPWLDTMDIKPGERWENSIRNAIRNSDFFIALLSKNTISKRGYVHKEIKLALKRLEETAVEDIYLIPVRIEECDVPTPLNEFHWINLYEENGWQTLHTALNEGIKRKKKFF